MAATKTTFMLYEDTFKLIYARLVLSTLDPHIRFRVIEVHPSKKRYLCEVESRGERWWQWVYTDHHQGHKMREKPKVKRKKSPTRI